MPKEQLTIREVAELLGRSTFWVQMHLPPGMRTRAHVDALLARGGRKPTPEQAAEIVATVAPTTQLTLREVAEQLGVSLGYAGQLVPPDQRTPEGVAQIIEQRQRYQHWLTMREVGERLGVSQPTASRLVGPRAPTLELVEQLAQERAAKQRRQIAKEQLRNAYRAGLARIAAGEASDEHEI